MTPRSGVVNAMANASLLSTARRTGARIMRNLAAKDFDLQSLSVEMVEQAVKSASQKSNHTTHEMDIADA